MTKNGGGRHLSSFPQYQILAETYGCPIVHKTYMSDHFGRCSGLHRRDLVGHFGCVNAIEFSNNGGEFIVSGGDDRRVVVWNVEKCVYGNGSPVTMKGEHGSNIFCTVFDNENRHIFSAGNDNQALRHDFATGETVGMYHHDNPVYGLNIHPDNSNVFVTASDDGKVLLWDIRASPLSGSSSCIALHESAFHAAIFSPVDSSIIATANSRNGVQLWDIRTPISCLGQFSYGMASMCAMGLRWNMTGDLITALRRCLPPVLYHVKNSSPIAEFHHPGYSNVCTMKSNCFAGSKDQYIVSGSDDFNVYIWEVPDDLDDESVSIITVRRAFMVLQGHRSIVNQVRFNTATNMLVSAGVEKVLKVWSPFPIPGGCNSKDVRPSTRQLYSYSDSLDFIQYSGPPVSHDEHSNRSTEEDFRMLAFFDSLIQHEKDKFILNSDDSTWDDNPWSTIPEGGGSENSDSDTTDSSVSRFLAREIFHRPAPVSSDREPSVNVSGEGVLRQFRRLGNAAVMRDLLNPANHSDEESHVQTPLKELRRELDSSQSSRCSPIVFHKRRHSNRCYRFHGHLKARSDGGCERRDFFSAEEEDKNIHKRTPANNGSTIPCSQGNTCSRSSENKTKRHIERSCGDDCQDGKMLQEKLLMEDINGQRSVDCLGTYQTVPKANDQSLSISNVQGPSNGRGNGNTCTAFSLRGDSIPSLSTDTPSCCANNNDVNVKSQKSASFIKQNSPGSGDEDEH